jgi:fluoride ion exporter CrcB/FEX
MTGATLTTIAIVAGTLLAGAVGAVLRAALVERSARAGTAVANLAGTSLLALVLVANDGGMLGDGAAVALAVGLSGSLTTFSGWIAIVADGLEQRPVVTLAVDVLLPLLTAVGVTVLVFATIA